MADEKKPRSNRTRAGNPKDAALASMTTFTRPTRPSSRIRTTTPSVNETDRWFCLSTI